MLTVCIIAAAAFSVVSATEWDAANYPNPTRGGFRECKMLTTATICDPDEILSENDRNRIHHELQQLERRTQQNHARTFCEKKGVTAALAIGKRVKGSSTEATKQMANNIKRTWLLDDQCEKSVVIVLITEDKKFWTARDDRVPVYGPEFTAIFKEQNELLKKRNYKQALMNMLQRTWEKALEKQTGGNPGGGRQSNNQRPQQPDQGGGQKMPGFKIPKIPIWVIIAIVAIVIPTLICCCICYCCCCKKSDGGTGDRGEASEGGGGRRSGGGFLSGLTRGAGIGGLAGMAGNLLNRRGGGESGRGFGGLFNRGRNYQQGSTNPVPPNNTGGGANPGTYPSKKVTDEGGGGSWA